MIETRPQKPVAEGGDLGHPEACHISLAAVTALGYNVPAASAKGQLHSRDD